MWHGGRRERIRCKACRHEFTPDRDDVDFSEWLFGVEGVECPHCGSYCPLEDDGRDDDT